MSAPQINLTEIVPLKWKTWVTLLGTLLTFIGPFILQVSTSLPSTAAFAVGLFFATMTTLGVYKAPYKPTGTVLAIDPNTPVALPASNNPMDPRIALPDPGTVVDHVQVTQADVSDRPQYPWK